MFFNLRASFIALCMLLLMATGMAQAALVAIPDLKNRVTDLTQTFSPDQQAQLEQKLAVFEQKKGSQIAVLILPTTQPEDIAQYAIRVAEKWKLGREKPDDGLLIVVAKEDRKLRIDVGYGLEGAIPDLIAKRVISEIISPQFKQGDYFGGLNAGLDKLIGLADGEILPPPATADTSANNSASGLFELLPLIFIGALVGGMILRGMFGTFFGSFLNGGAIAAIVWFFGAAVLTALLVAVIAFIFTLAMGGRGLGGYGGMPMGGGGWSGGGSNSWGGGAGGGFGGGGASGDW